MSLLHAVGGFEGFASGFSGLNTRAEHAGAQFSQLHTRNDSTSGNSTTNANTVSLFIDSYSEDFEYAASIIQACSDKTVYAIACTGGPKSVSIAGLGYADSGCTSTGAKTYTLTEGPSTYAVETATTTTTLGKGVTLTIAESCSLTGTTAAQCTATLKAGVDGTSTTTSATTTYTGASYYRFDVAITGGAEKTANPTGTCSSSASGLSTKAMALWALTGVVGVAGFLAA